MHELINHLSKEKFVPRALSPDPLRGEIWLDSIMKSNEFSSMNVFFSPNPPDYTTKRVAS